MFPATPLRFSGRKRGRDWSNGSIAAGEGRQGTIINVFTEPQWRRHGIAGLLIKGIVAWSKSERLDRLILHASDEGRSLYEKFGFVASNEMRLSGGQ